MPTLTSRYEAAFPTSRRLYEQARGIFPDGVTHDLRYLEPFPIYVERGQGAHKWDVDGHELIDYWSGHGALLLGHSHPAVVEAVQRQVGRATHPGACHELEIEWGRWVQRLVPSAERSALHGVGHRGDADGPAPRPAAHRPAADPEVPGPFPRLARFRRPRRRPALRRQPEPGVAPTVVAATVVAPPNDLAAVEQALQSDPDIGCVILEPTGGHWGLVPIRGEFLRGLRDLATRLGVLLIFDEVITGFRVSPGGAQAHYGVTPDLTTLAKVLAGGLPGGCVAGREDVLAGLEFRPGKPKMRHPGTFNANPLSAAAGIAALGIVADGEPCRIANEAARLLRQGLNQLFTERGWDWVAYGEFSMVRLLPGYSGPHPQGDDFIPYGGSFDRLDGPREVRLIHAFRRGMLLHGVDLPGLGGMTTAAHTAEDVERTVVAVAGTLAALRAEGTV